jgi:predicted ATP-dependent serine protease
MAITLFFAREKLGKTTLLTWIMKQLAMGLEIFGLQSEPQPVLFASLEEGVHLIKMRAKQMRISPTAPIHVLTEVSHKTKPPITVLEEAVIATGAKVVVVDSLTAYALAHPKRTSPDTTDLLQPLSKLAAKRRFALVIIHHGNKGNDEFRGHTSTGAAVDTIASLSIVKGAPSNVRRLRYYGRYGAGEMYVARDPQTGDYELVESDSVPTEVARGAVTDEQLAERLIAARKVEGGATKEILRRAGGVKAVRTDGMVEQLVNEGRLTKERVRGGYRFFAAA